MTRELNVTGLVAGIALVALGIAVLLDDAGTINLEFAYAGPSLLAALGAVLLVSGLTSRRRHRD
jgi:hypothetical protein